MIIKNSTKQQFPTAIGLSFIFILYFHMDLRALYEVRKRTLMGQAGRGSRKLAA